MDADAVRAFVAELPEYELVGSTYPEPQAALRRARALLDGLGRPDREFVVAQVAGTNGKGSTSAMLAAILAAAGGATGLFTSPHLARWEERIRIGGDPIEDALLARAGAQVVEACRRTTRDQGRVTRFEFWTALACAAFAAARCTAAVLEVGLGGRFDPTTAAATDLAVITRIALDHELVLGGTLGAIAAEKAAIIRHGIPAVSAPQAAEVLAVIRERAAHERSPVLVGGADFTWSLSDGGLEVRVLDERFDRLRPALRGAHQRENAATAVAAAVALGDFGFSVDVNAVRAGLASTRWPGRFEVIDGIVLDGAHNPDGAQALVLALREELGGVPVSLVLGCHRDKDLPGIVAALAPGARRFIAVRAAHPRARAPEELAAAARRAGIADASVGGGVADGIALARRHPEPVVVCGSLAVIAEARAALGLVD